MERTASEIVLQSAKRGQAGGLSPRFWHCFEFVHAGHRFWRKWHRAKLYHDHLSGMILGRTLDYFLGGNSTVQSVAQMVLIADRVAACADRVLKVERCLKEIGAVWNRRCLRHVRARPIAGNTAPWDTLYGKLTEEKERWMTLLILTFSCMK
ncbi:MAG: hypothetical protein KDK65_03140, partial [Chlamydiia bacterium]|nr:hypothetical protein [Chlamydiia bacterium]